MGRDMDHALPPSMLHRHRVWIEMVTILMGKHAEVGMQQALDESHRNADDEDVISNQ